MTASASASSWGGPLRQCAALVEGHSDGVLALAFIDGGRIASGSRDKTMRVWDLEAGSCEYVFRDAHWVLALAPLGRSHLASGSWDKTVRLWDLDSGRCVRVFEGHGNSVSALVQINGGLLASASYDKTLKLWDIETGQCVSTLEGHTNLVSALTLSDKGGLASASWDMTVRLWDLQSGTCVRSLEGHSDWVRALAPLGGGRLASGSWDNTVKIWDIHHSDCVRTFEGHGGIVWALVPFGRCLASGSADRTIMFWDIERGKRRRVLRGHDSSVFALAALPNGRLASGGTDGNILLWEPDTGEGGLASYSSTLRAWASPRGTGSAPVGEFSAPTSPTGASAFDFSPMSATPAFTDAADGTRKHLLLSGRLNDRGKVTYIKRVRVLLEARRVPVCMVASRSAQSLAEQTAAGLCGMKAMCAFCHWDYGANTDTGHETYRELQYAHEHAIPIFSVKLCEIWPPEPPDERGRVQNGIVLRDCLVRIDGGSSSEEEVADAIAKAWRELRTVVSL